jgi:hypothetical protein
METRMGIRMLAPPRPVRAPRNPTGIDKKSSETMLSIKEILRCNKKEFGACGFFPYLMILFILSEYFGQTRRANNVLEG